MDALRRIPRPARKTTTGSMYNATTCCSRARKTLPDGNTVVGFNPHHNKLPTNRFEKEQIMLPYENKKKGMGGYVVIRVARPRSTLPHKWHRGAARPPPLTPVSSMRSFWGLMRAYWFSERWKEAWGLTLVIVLLTALSSKASVWLAEASGDLVNSIASSTIPRIRRR